MNSLESQQKTASNTSRILKTLLAAAALGLTASCAVSDAAAEKLPEVKADAYPMSLVEALQQRRSARNFKSQALTDEQVAALLWAAAGENRPEQHLRTVPSARNKQEVQVYALSAVGASLYEPATHSLKLITTEDLRPLAAGPQVNFAAAPLIVLIVGDNSKLGKREITYADAGFVSQNICLMATALGLSSRPRMTMEKDELKAALKLGPQLEIILNNPVGYAED